MANKGIPLMGRDPDGEAKIINVDENGNVKVQQSGTSVTHELGSGAFAQVVGETVGGRESSNFTPFSMRSHRRFTIYIDNTKNIVGITGGLQLRFYTTDEIVSGNDYFYSKEFSAIPAGGEFILNSSDEVFDVVAMGLGVTVYAHSRDNPEDVTYSVTIMGGN